MFLGSMQPPPARVCIQLKSLLELPGLFHIVLSVVEISSVLRIFTSSIDYNTQMLSMLFNFVVILLILFSISVRDANLAIFVPNFLFFKKKNWNTCE